MLCVVQQAQNCLDLMLYKPVLLSNKYNLAEWVELWTILVGKMCVQEEKTQTQIAGGLQAVPKKTNLNVNRRLCVP